MEGQTEHRRAMLFALLVAAAPALSAAAAGPDGAEQTTSAADRSSTPVLSPDLRGVVVPPNIAPINMQIPSPDADWDFTVSGADGTSISGVAKRGRIRFRASAWRTLLEGNRGRQLALRISPRGPTRDRTSGGVVTLGVAKETIDPVLVTRRINPTFRLWQDDMRIEQRDLTSFSTSTVFAGWHYGQGCINCHAFSANSAKSMSIATRASSNTTTVLGSHSLVARNGEALRFNTKCGYTSWHPNGRHVAYSLNKVDQYLHVSRKQARDVYDHDSEIVILDTETGEAFTTPALAHPDVLETYPTWSPDGKMLYFSSAPIPRNDDGSVQVNEFPKPRYGLRRVTVDVATRRVGTAETVLEPEAVDGSILLPRVSPDGRWLLCCVCDWGCFPIFRPSSDLVLLDLETDAVRRMDEWCSERSESYHSWSSNGRWCAFSSKRRDGVFTGIYLAYFGADGKGEKPFLLPQERPDFYDSCLETFSVPELLTEPIRVSSRRLARAARLSTPGTDVTLPVTSMTPRTESGVPTAVSNVPWQRTGDHPGEAPELDRDAARREGGTP